MKYVLVIKLGDDKMTDPVCGRKLDERTAKFKMNYGGNTYFFCTVTCKKKFKRRPNKFIK